MRYNSGHIGRQPLQDIIFIGSCSPPAGPFPNISSFHDYFVNPRNPDNATFGDLHIQCARSFPTTCLSSLHTVTFTAATSYYPHWNPSPHCRNHRLASIWLAAGVWEFCKAQWTCGGQVRSGSGSIYRGSWKGTTCTTSGTTLWSNLAFSVGWLSDHRRCCHIEGEPFVRHPGIE